MKLPVVLLCGPKGLIVYVFVPNPPVATTVAVPFEPPKQDGETKVALVINIGAGCVMVKVVVFEQPLPSTAVIVYVAAGKPVNIPVVFDAGLGLIEYVTVGVPPIVVAVIVPSLKPLHEGAVKVADENNKLAG